MKKSIFLLSILISCTTMAQLTVSDLRVEHMTNPPQIDTQQPRFSWINSPSDSNQKGQRQTAYQIAVASNEANLAEGKYDIWDSGRCNSEESLLIPYKGKKLQSGEDYYWMVRTWDKAGNPSAWSTPAHWGMGLLQASEWKAKWIRPVKDDFSAPLLRKTFTLNKKVKKAKAFICGLGFFELYTNGERIGEDYLVPNISNYTKRYDLDKAPIVVRDNFSAYRVLYLSYDITAQLHKGDNTLGVILGNGWYHPDKRIASIWGKPCLICQIEITLEDGSKQTIITDTTWKTHSSAINYSGIYKGETYDARQETPTWSLPSLNDSDWDAALIADAPTGELTAQNSPSDRITEILRPKTLTHLADGSYLVNFGKEIAGWVRLKDITGTAGDSVKIHYFSESPQGNGTYIFKGEGKESYAPRFTWFVFSEIRISGIKKLLTENIQAEAVNTDVPLNTTFYTSNTLYNKINTIWQRSQLDNMHGCIASDCPHRERLPYTGDGEAAAATVMYNFDAAAFYQKWIRDMRDAQDKDSGYEPNSAPWQPGCGGGVAWGAAMNIIPWDFYQHYGDLQLLRQCFPAMKGQVRHMLTWLTHEGIMNQQKTNDGTDKPCYWLNLGEWCPPYKLPDDRLVHTFYLWLCLDINAQAAKVLNLKKDEEYYTRQAQTIRENFHRFFYDEEHKTYGDFGANVFALKMGVPDSVKSDIIQALHDEVAVGHQGHLHTGFLGTKYFFEILSRNGLHETALKAMNKTDYPSYGNWISQGATTTWEQWDGGNSHNHPMQGSGLTWFYRCLAGINTDPALPAFRHIIIRPYFTPGLNVHYDHITPYGLLLSDIRYQGKETIFTLTIPTGSTATLTLPTTAEKITEGGISIRQDKDLKILSSDEQKTIIKLGQGIYNFHF